MKILKCKKALSPVVASIILIAVTVAVSIAVAAWMGALSFTFMGTEQLTITKLYWGPANNGFRLVVNNTGTKDVTITQIQVNYQAITGATYSPSLPLVLKSGRSTEITVSGFTYVNGTRYDISIVTQSGYKFTEQFIGGQNKE
jgi:flagellin-like protein